MSRFDKIIGYEEIKRELAEIVDMIKKPELYEKLGARLPSGVLLDGAPGLGKTMLATAFLEECGAKTSYVLRRNKPGDDFIDEIRETFAEAKLNTPSVILLDDMDKFMTDAKDKEELVVVQACIDDAKGYGVFVIATTNDILDIPDSLLRAGRFDRRISVYSPTGSDSERIVSYYMSEKPISKSVNFEDVAKMLIGKSCAELECIINEAAISAAFERKEKIEMKHLVDATLRKAYGVTKKCDKNSHEKKEETAYHEAGHAVISEVLTEGSVGLLSTSSETAEIGGFMLRCEPFIRRAHRVLVALGGKAASEMKYGKIASGAVFDLSDAVDDLRYSIQSVGTYGLSAIFKSGRPSDEMLLRQEIAVDTELERYLFLAKQILAENREFLDKLAKELVEKETLLYSDIKKIRECCSIKPAIVN